MKRLSCSAMGGGDKCKEVFEGETAEELLQNSTKHIMGSSFHEDIRREMATGGKVKKEEWMKFYHKLWEDTPEV